MDDYATYLLEEAKSDIVALHQFKILNDPERRGFHFFFEGDEDSLFYMPEARRWTKNLPVYTYDCGGKKNVIEVRDAIMAAGYNPKNCLFFVDRDFDDILNCQVILDEQTYITDNYSIESDISCEYSVEILLSDFLKISPAEPEFAEIVEFVRAAYKEFHVAVRPLSSWILAAKQTGCKPNLRNTNGLKGILKIKDKKPEIDSAGFIEFKKNVLSNGFCPSISDVIYWRRKLDINDAKSWTRGKYALWFFQTIMLDAIERANAKRKAAGGKRIRVPSALRDGRIFELLGGRVPPPSSLENFYRNQLQ